MNNDEKNSGRTPLLEEILAAENAFRDQLEPDPSVRERLKQRLQPVVPFWKKPVPAWAAAAALLLLLLPAFLFRPANGGTTVVAAKPLHDTLFIRDTIRVAAAPQQGIPLPSPVPVQSSRQPAAGARLKSPAPIVLTGYTLPARLPITGFTMADDTSLKKFVVKL